MKLCPVAIADKLDITPGQLDQDTLIFESNFKLHRNGTATKLVRDRRRHLLRKQSVLKSHSPAGADDRSLGQ